MRLTDLLVFEEILGQTFSSTL